MSAFITMIANPNTVQLLILIKTLAIVAGVAGAIALSMWTASMLSLQGNPSNGILVVGIILFVTAIVVASGANYGINYANDNRPFNITPAYGFDESKFQPIASLKDNSLTNGISGHGTFFLGCGGMTISGGNSVPVYVFYKKMPNEEFILDTLPSANVYIKEDGGADPKIEWIYRHEVSEKKVYADDGETIGGGESVALAKTLIHVPKGTVKIDYNLDSELK